MKTWTRGLCAAAALICGAGGVSPAAAASSGAAGASAAVAAQSGSEQASPAHSTSAHMKAANATPAQADSARAMSAQAQSTQAKPTHATLAHARLPGTGLPHSALTETATPIQSTPIQSTPIQTASSQDLGRASSAEEWYAASAKSVIGDRAASSLKQLSQEEVDSLEVGRPINAFAFAEVSDRDRSDTPRIVESNHWIAPLLLNGEPVGTLGIVFESGQAKSAVVTDNSSFATAVNAPESGARIVVDPSIKGWFIVFADNTISPLDSGARQALAGLMPLSEFGAVRRNFIVSEQSVSTAADDETGQPAGRPGGNITLFLILGVAALVMLAGVLLRLRRESSKRAEPEDKPPIPTPPENASQGPRTFLTETGEMVRIYERPKRCKEGEGQ